nr:hypothetical protein [uncultured Kingella sp.]
MSPNGAFNRILLNLVFRLPQGFYKVSGCLITLHQGSLKIDLLHHNASAAKQ